MRSIRQGFHETLYLSLQSLRGRHVGPFMRRLQEWERLDRKSFERLTGRMLEEALLHAWSRVPLYSTGAWREAWERGSPRRLASWPVLERKTLITHRERLLARGHFPGAFRRRSSASSGEPVTIRLNPHAGGWSWAHEYRCLGWFGVHPGDKTLLLWGGGHPLLDWVRNCKVIVTRELDERRLEEAARYLLRERPVLCMGLPSAITQLARYVRARYPHVRGRLVPFVKLGGEQVYPFQREEIARAFGARVFESYGCTEVGPIAHECPFGSRHVLAEHVKLEVFRGDEPAGPGEFGDLVLTSLVNRAMPLVRCRIGDRGRLSTEACPCGLPHPVLDDLVGRATDMFVAADGALVHGSALGQRLQQVLAVTPADFAGQICFQQLDPRHWKVMVESRGQELGPLLEIQLVEVVRSIFGRQCQVQVEVVRTVPREPSGKFRYYRTNIGGASLRLPARRPGSGATRSSPGGIRTNG